MALLTTARTAQGTLVSTFRFKHDDTMVPKAGGAALDFGAANLAATTVVAIPLPPNSVVTGGYIMRDEAFDAATYNVTVGDSGSATRYLGSTDVKALGATALVPTGFINESGLNIELVFDAADACTTGQATLVVEYIVLGRACEVQIA